MNMKKIFSVILSACCLTAGFTGNTAHLKNITTVEAITSYNNVESIPQFNNEPYVVINNNQPYFSENDITVEPFETYSNLDELGRCGIAYANICEEIMPTEDRGSISSVTPTGWQSVKYDFIDGDYLYNRCHLIGFQLAGENANEKNLITGTRYLNVDGMLPFENSVDDYVEETDNHVLYRVTPDFEGDNLVADGVQIEAYSVEDNGEGICYNVYCYNAQPGITIDYTTGISRLNAQTSVKGDANNDGSLNIRDGALIASALANGTTDTLSDNADYNGDGNINVRDAAAIAKYLADQYVPPVVTTKVTTSAPKPTTTTTVSVIQQAITYVLNTNSKKFHYSSCASAKRISDKNRATSNESRAVIISWGYEPCKVCKP